MKKVILFLFTILVCWSCSDIDDLENRLKVVENSVKELLSAYQNGKIIKDVKPLSGNGHTGWTITFSDGQSIDIYNGADAITPVFDINSEGYWMVSYDNGETFSLLTDKEGNGYISKGDDGISVRVVISEEGKYVFELYSSAAPDVVVKSIETSISSNASNHIVSIIKDVYTGVIKLEMADGTQYEFNLDVTYPTGIVVLAESVILPRGGETTFAFRVNPSNAVVDLNLTSESPMFQLDMVIESMARSYVTDPKNFLLDKIVAHTDADGNVIKGQYIATVKDLGVSTDYCQGVTVVLNTKDGRDEAIQVSSEMFQIKTADKPQFTSFSVNDQYATELDKEFILVRLPYGTDVSALTTNFTVSEGTVSVNGAEISSSTKLDFTSPVKFVITGKDGCPFTYIVSISYSDLPVVYINTKDAAPIVSKEDWLKNTEIYITNAGEYNEVYEKSQIRGRGNTTWGNPKKPYAIKLDSKQEVLGMPKHKRWVLLANYFDKTCIRNAVAFEIANRMPGLAWTPRGKHVDVVLNGAFIGNYYLCEQIKVDKNRVNITELESGDIDSESITGGYLLEVDTHYDEVNKFMSYNSVVLENGQYQQLPFMVKEPDEDVLAPAQFSWIQNHIEEIRVALYEAGSTTAGYLQYIDLDSFIDYWLVYELTGTGEPTHPKSVYMYKDRGGKMHAGPVWDFDYYTFQPYYKDKLINTRAVWNDRIINEPANWPIIKQRWNACKESYRSIAEEIDRLHNYTKESAQYNAQLWPITTIDINKENSMSVDDAVARMKTYYVDKFNYMDSYINTYF